jgi:hypothetical protein
MALRTNVLSSTLYNFQVVTGSLHEPDQISTWHYTEIGVRSRCLKSQTAPDMQTHRSEHIAKGRSRLVIPGRVLNGNMAIRMQCLSQEDNHTLEPEEAGSAAFNCQVGPLALRFHTQMSTALFEGDFNGAITNDKFCMTRQGRLQLSHHHLPLRLRSQHSEECLRYPPKKPFDNGGTYEEKPMEASSAVSCDAGCSTSLGSGLSESPALDPMPSFTAGDQTCCQGSTGGVR